MKVAIITTDNRQETGCYANPEPYFGTAPTALFEGLAAMPDCEVHVISCLQHPVRSPLKLAENIYYHSLVVPKRGWLRGAYLGCIRAVRKKLREIQPDIVHGQGTERNCAISAVRSGFPNVLTIHGNMRLIAKINQAPPFSFEWLAARIERFTIPQSDGIVCITNYTQRAVASLARKTWIVPNAVDGAFFKMNPIPASPPEILCVGQISMRKNQVRLIEALRSLTIKRNFSLIFYGGTQANDPYSKKFLDLVQKNPWCRFAGFADRAELRKAMERAAMLILPSLEDNCPMTVLESMAAGLPVAAAAVGGVPELIDDNVDGLLFNPENEEQMRNAVEKILFDENVGFRLAAAARKKAGAQFHPQQIARRHLEIYREVLAQTAW